MIEITSIDDLRAALAPLRNSLLNHPIYGAVDSIPRLRVFMSQHVFAVWDFMCLVKRLQRDLTSLQELWLPPMKPTLARFINSIVLGEESDIDVNGKIASHFDLYLSAMEDVGASTTSIQRFINLLSNKLDVSTALGMAGAAPGVQRFVNGTLKTAFESTTIEVLASFLYGREDLIPQMFSQLLPQWSETRDAIRFAYYIKRHIDLDGDHHGPEGLSALSELIADNTFALQSALQSAELAIKARIDLWDSIYEELISN